MINLKANFIRYHGLIDEYYELVKIHEILGKKIEKIVGVHPKDSPRTLGLEAWQEKTEDFRKNMESSEETNKVANLFSEGMEIQERMKTIQKELLKVATCVAENIMNKGGKDGERE